MTYFDDRVAAIAKESGPRVFGLIGWIDPSGTWWIAPLGSTPPDPDRPVPPAWMPIKFEERDDLL